MSGNSEKDVAAQTLNDSWVKLPWKMEGTLQEHPSMEKPLGINTQKLLLEAHRVSSCTSSSRGSPRSPHSPNNEPADLVGQGVQELSVLQPGQLNPIPTDWIWDWSSRPELMPPSGMTYKHPRKSKLSVRNTRLMQDGPLSLPVLLLTHACTFFFGAAVMFIYFKRNCSCSLSFGRSAVTLD